MKRWFLENDLLVNADKSEVMLVGTAVQLRKMDHIRTVNVADALLPVSEKVESLGVILDNQLKFGGHVNSVAKACNYQIWALRRITTTLPMDIAQPLACSIVSSKLDYCNAVLYGSPAKYVAVLQRVRTEQSRSCSAATAKTYSGEAASTITPLASSYSADRVQTDNSDFQSEDHQQAGLSEPASD